MPKLSSFDLTKITQENLQEKTRDNDFEAVKEPSTSTGDITSTCRSPVNNVNASGNSSDDDTSKFQEFHSLTWSLNPKRCTRTMV